MAVFEQLSIFDPFGCLQGKVFSKTSSACKIRQVYHGLCVAKFIQAILTIYEWFDGQDLQKKDILITMWKDHLETIVTFQDIYSKVLTLLNYWRIKSLWPLGSFKLDKITNNYELFWSPFWESNWPYFQNLKEMWS